LKLEETAVRKQFLVWCALAAALVACGNDNANGIYGGGVGAVTNPPNNYIGGVCGVSVANDYNAMAARCNNSGGYDYGHRHGHGYGSNCTFVAQAFLQRYPGINCTIQTTNGQMLNVNAPMIQSTLMHMGQGGVYGPQAYGPTYP
jgi:hypothetical protein